MSCDIDTLKNYNNNNKLTIFVGAGVSKSSKLPSWGELIYKIKTDLSIDGETDYLKIAQLYYLSCGETVYYQKIKEFFPKTAKPTEIQKLIFDLEPANIITTNWDNLLEQTAEDNGLIYDVISKDAHLVQSELEKHIIKMHGDFRDNNIVFKEDDYINYKKNFPLIENYVKSILSTNAILFLGYSYSDINLKQITKWLQNNSTIMPPMFLVVFKEDTNQSRYLENFGIKTIIIKNENESFGFDSYSNKIATFLTSLNSNKKHGDIKNISNSDIENMAHFDIVDIVYKKLKPLDDLNAISLKQIQSTLTNCGFSYQQFTYKNSDKIDNFIFLEFYDTVRTGDINKKIRFVFNKFREILNNLSDEYSNEIKEKIREIFSILHKANINGYIKTNDKNMFHKQTGEFAIFKIPRMINNTHKQLYNFKFNDFEVKYNDIKSLMQKAFLYYQKSEFLKSYNLNSRIIKLCLKQKNHIQLFLVMFNHNVLLQRMKDPWYLEDTKKRTKYQIAESNREIEPYDLNKKFYEFPKSIQKVLKEIKPFVNYDYLYRLAFEIDDELDKKVKQKKAMENNGQITLDTNVTRTYSKQKNLIYFLLNNFIMLEKNITFTAINKKIIRISLIRQMQKEYFSLDKMELFAVIKYIKYDDLIELIDEFDKFKLKIEIKTLNWIIIKVFPNIVNLFNDNKSLYSLFEGELRKILYLCSLNKLTKKQSKKMLEQIKTLINGKKINLYIYQSINNFIDSQENINNQSLIDILEMMINKIICYRANIWDRKVVEDNSFWSPFKHLTKENILYSNIDLVEKLLKEFTNNNEKQKIYLSQGFLMNLHNISNDSIKELIEKFILSIDVDGISELKIENFDINNTQKFDYDNLNNYFLKISHKLFLVIEKFKDIDDELIEELKLCSGKNLQNFLGQITGQVKYIVEEIGIKDLEELLVSLLKNIDEVNQKLQNDNTMII